MKKIYNILLTAAALFTISTVVNAQEPGPYSIAKQITDPKDASKSVEYPEETNKPVVFNTEKKVAYAKNVSKPFSDGTYWIKLETFATGTATYSMSSEPADIVLVLDFSQSMTNQYSTTRTYVPYVNNTYQNINQNGRYILYEGEYHQVQYRRLQQNGQNVAFNSGGYAWAFFQVGTTTYYLDGYGNNAQIREASDPTNMSDHPVWSGSGNFGNDTVMWSDILYASDNNVSRLEALKVAVNNFIDVIYHNDNYDENENLRDEPLGNRISIVMFSTVAATQIVGNGWTDVSTSSREKNTELLNAFIAVTNTPMQTHADEGMSKAITLLSQIDEDRMAEASRTVVLFTDGAPGENPSWTNPTSTTVANNTIERSKTVKTSYSATVFSVLVGNATGDMVTYMNAVTSNYPEANSLEDIGRVCTDSEYYSGEKEYLYKETADFYKNAGADLSGVFEEIAHQSGGDTNTSLSAATSTVDIVSNSFILPEGAFAEDADINDYVKVFTAKLQEIDDEGTYVFEEEILAPYSPDTFDIYENGQLKQEGVDVDGTVENPTIRVVLEGTNNIKVTGFDYANNFCGPVTDEHGRVTYQGHKLIIMIPIQMNPDAVGGPNVATNEQGSGIIVPGQTEPIITFESPAVSLPVNIYIEKTGLNHGESAKFKIERAEIPLNGTYTLANLTFSYVSTVFVTQPEDATDETPVTVKVKGLPANKSTTVGYLYKVTEEDWAWSYGRDKTPQYTVTSKVDNPFTFDNEKKDGIEMKLHHAESKVNNVFKSTAATKEYNDSKKNERE
jgi:hypothetical protein